MVLHKKIYHSTIKPVLNLVTFSKLRHRKKEKKQAKFNMDQIDKLVDILNQESKKTKKPVVVYVSHFDYYSPL